MSVSSFQIRLTCACLDSAAVGRRGGRWQDGAALVPTAPRERRRLELLFFVITESASFAGLKNRSNFSARLSARENCAVAEHLV